MLWGKKWQLPFPQAKALGQVTDAECRAVQLLSTIVPSSVFVEYLSTGEIQVTGPSSGYLYTISHSEITKCVTSIFGPKTFCVASNGKSILPPTDEVITKWLLINFSERTFLGLANRSGPHFAPLKSYDFMPADIFNIGHMADNPLNIMPEPELELELDPRQPSPIGTRRILSDEEFANQLLQKEKQHRHLKRKFLQYDYNISSFAGRYKCIDSSIWMPHIHNNQEHGLAMLCLVDDHLDRRTSIVEYVPNSQQESGLKVPLLEWPSGGELDDAFIFVLLSSYTGNQLDEIHKHSSSHNKVVMSLATYNSLSERSMLPNVSIILDKRLGNLMLYLPPAEELGLLAYNQRRAGFVILNKNAIDIKIYWNGKISQLSREHGVEMCYSGFPAGNYLSICYDQCLYSLTDIGQSNGVDELKLSKQRRQHGRPGIGVLAGRPALQSEYLEQMFFTGIMNG